MIDIDMQSPTDEFAACWAAAGRHIQSRHPGPQLRWLKARLEPPFLEHLSFALGNQLFFVRLEGRRGVLRKDLVVPGSREGVKYIADACRGHACLMPMRWVDEAWRPEATGWGLVELGSGQQVDPSTMATSESVAMSDWEVHDFAVQVVRSSLENEGRSIMSSQGNPDVDPSLWFVGDEGPEAVVVRAVQAPVRTASRPKNAQELHARCAQLAKRTHFASVSIASAETDWAAPESTHPLNRGEAMHTHYAGLEPLLIDGVESKG